MRLLSHGSGLWGWSLIEALDRANDLASADATCADADGLGVAVDHGAHALNIGQPARAGLDVRVGDQVTGRWFFIAEVTNTCHFECFL